MIHAPIAIFAFNRPEHLRRTLNSISQNRGFFESPLYIYCDGPRGPQDYKLVRETQDIVNSFYHPNKNVFLSQTNCGLRESITTGISAILSEYDYIIVLEDDLEFSPDFLYFMNSALFKYRHIERVFQISGFSFPVNSHPLTDSAYFLPFVSSWGWGTWRSRWREYSIDICQAKSRLNSFRWRWRFDINGSYPYSRMLSMAIDNRNSSWAIWFNYHAFINDRISLYPVKSLVLNHGFDGSGTHCRNEFSLPLNLDFNDPNVKVNQLPDEITTNKPYLSQIQRYLRIQRGVLRYAADTLYRFAKIEIKK